MSDFAYDGRTPRLTIVGAAGTVDLYNERSAYPFPGLAIQREVDVRPTRKSATGPRKTYFVVEDYNGAEETLDFSATVTKAQHDLLRTISRANPPTVTVTWRDETWPGILTSLTPPPDDTGPSDVAAYGPTEFLASGTIQRTDISAG